MSNEENNGFSTIGEQGLKATYVKINTEESKRRVEEAFNILFDAILNDET